MPVELRFGIGMGDGDHFRRLRLNGVQPHLVPGGPQIGLDIPAISLQRNYLFGRFGQSCEQIQVLFHMSGPRYDRPTLDARVGRQVRVTAPVLARGSHTTLWSPALSSPPVSRRARGSVSRTSTL